MHRKFILLIILIFFITLISIKSTGESIESDIMLDASIQIAPKKTFVLPIDRAMERITKKRFGDFISPENSPVQPERFSGYHTGVDFEIFPEEENADVKIYSICRGPLIEKRLASGYGGVVVQRCFVENTDSTIIYGHLNISSIEAELGMMLEEGEVIGILGKSFSEETDGERKHLHLGIHRGPMVSILGYARSIDRLDSWFDPEIILNLK